MPPGRLSASGSTILSHGCWLCPLPCRGPKGGADLGADTCLFHVEIRPETCSTQFRKNYPLSLWEDPLGESLDESELSAPQDMSAMFRAPNYVSREMTPGGEEIDREWIGKVSPTLRPSMLLVFMTIIIALLLLLLLLWWWWWWLWWCVLMEICPFLTCSYFFWQTEFWNLWSVKKMHHCDHDRCGWVRWTSQCWM